MINWKSFLLLVIATCSQLTAILDVLANSKQPSRNFLDPNTLYCSFVVLIVLNIYFSISNCTISASCNNMVIAWGCTISHPIDMIQHKTVLIDDVKE